MPNMLFLTLGQAAKASGRSKAGILDAIRSGRLSASRDDKKQWQIDPAELNRVYPTVKPNNQNERERTPDETPDLTDSKNKLILLERIISTLENERDDLRHRLNQSEEERRAVQGKLTAFITYQPPPPVTESYAVTNATKGSSGFFQKLFGIKQRQDKITKLEES